MHERVGPVWQWFGVLVLWDQYDTDHQRGNAPEVHKPQEQGNNHSPYNLGDVNNELFMQTQFVM